jgi:hypothetical protein
MKGQEYHRNYYKKRREKGIGGNRNALRTNEGNGESGDARA